MGVLSVQKACTLLCCDPGLGLRPGLVLSDGPPVLVPWPVLSLKFEAPVDPVAGLGVDSLSRLWERQEEGPYLGSTLCERAVGGQIAFQTNASTQRLVTGCCQGE